MKRSDFIRREDAIIEMMDNDVDHAQGTDGREVVQILSDIPAADVVPVVHGKWIEEWWHGEKTRKCSVCNLTQTVNVYNGEVKFNYCPYCGAKMEEES